MAKLQRLWEGLSRFDTLGFQHYLMIKFAILLNSTSVLLPPPTLKIQKPLFSNQKIYSSPWTISGLLLAS